MLALKDIEKEVSALPKEKYVDFRKWFFSYDFKNWDQQIKEDSKAGKLDFLIDEAMAEKESGDLKQL